MGSNPNDPFLPFYFRPEDALKRRDNRDYPQPDPPKRKLGLNWRGLLEATFGSLGSGRHGGQSAVPEGEPIVGRGLPFLIDKVKNLEPFTEKVTPADQPYRSQGLAPMAQDASRQAPAGTPPGQHPIAEGIEVAKAAGMALLTQFADSPGAFIVPRGAHAEMLGMAGQHFENIAEMRASIRSVLDDMAAYEAKAATATERGVGASGMSAGREVGVVEAPAGSQAVGGAPARKALPPAGAGSGRVIRTQAPATGPSGEPIPQPPISPVRVYRGESGPRGEGSTTNVQFFRATPSFAGGPQGKEIAFRYAGQQGSATPGQRIMAADLDIRNPMSFGGVPLRAGEAPNPRYVSVQQLREALVGRNGVTEEEFMAAVPQIPKTWISENGQGVHPREDPNAITETFAVGDSRELTELAKRAGYDAFQYEGAGRPMGSGVDEWRPFSEDQVTIVNEITPLDRKIAETHLNTDGSTFDPRTGKSMAGEDTWAVGAHKDREETLAGPPSEEDIALFRKANADLLSDPETYVGTWASPDGHVLDIIRLYEDVEVAMEAGRASSQTDIFNLKSFETRPVTAADPFAGVDEYDADMTRALFAKGRPAAAFLDPKTNRPIPTGMAHDPEAILDPGTRARVMEANQSGFMLPGGEFITREQAAEMFGSGESSQLQAGLDRAQQPLPTYEPNYQSETLPLLEEPVAAEPKLLPTVSFTQELERTRFWLENLITPESVPPEMVPVTWIALAPSEGWNASQRRAHIDMMVQGLKRAIVTRTPRPQGDERPTLWGSARERTLHVLSTAINDAEMAAAKAAGAPLDRARLAIENARRENLISFAFNRFEGGIRTGAVQIREQVRLPMTEEELAQKVAEAPATPFRPGEEMTPLMYRIRSWANGPLGTKLGSMPEQWIAEAESLMQEAGATDPTERALVMDDYMGRLGEIAQSPSTMIEHFRHPPSARRAALAVPPPPATRSWIPVDEQQSGPSYLYDPIRDAVEQMAAAGMPRQQTGAQWLADLKRAGARHAPAMMELQTYLTTAPSSRVPADRPITAEDFMGAVERYAPRLRPVEYDEGTHPSAGESYDDDGDLEEPMWYDHFRGYPAYVENGYHMRVLRAPGTTFIGGHFSEDAREAGGAVMNSARSEIPPHMNSVGRPGLMEHERQSDWAAQIRDASKKIKVWAEWAGVPEQEIRAAVVGWQDAQQDFLRAQEEHFAAARERALGENTPEAKSAQIERLQASIAEKDRTMDVADRRFADIIERYAGTRPPLESFPPLNMPYARMEDWVSLGFADLLSEAVRRGKSFVTWTSGRVHAHKYGQEFADAIEQIRWRHAGTAGAMRGPPPPRGQTYGELTYTPRGGESKTIALASSELADHVGRERAEWLLANPGVDHFPANNEIVTDAGIARMLDEVWPGILKNWAKKNDLPIELTEIKVNGDYYPGIMITPEIAARVRHGLATSGNPVTPKLKKEGKC